MTKKKLLEDDALVVKSVGKAFEVLECFEQTSQSERELSLMDICRLTGFDKSTAQRFTHTLQMLGYINKNESSRRYSLSLKVLNLAFHFLRNDAFIEAVNPHLFELCQRSHCRVSLSLFDDTETVYAARHQYKSEYYSSSLLGKRVPIYCSGGGRSILACLDAGQRDDILDRSEFIAFTHHTVLDRQIILDEIELAGKKGYGLTKEQFAYGELGLGAALVDRHGYPLAAIQMAINQSEICLEEFEKKYAPMLLETVQRIGAY